MKIDVKFKHKRFNLIQAVYGDLSEDASHEAVQVVEERLDHLMETIENAAKLNPEFGESHALEICVNMAQTNQELILFVHFYSKASRCPVHPFIEMIKQQMDSQSPE